MSGLTIGFTSFLKEWGLQLVLYATIFLRVLAVYSPKEKVFDEAYYVPAALDLLSGKASNPEHPFLGKVWGGLGIAILGDNFVGWRVVYVVLALFALLAFYVLARRFMIKELAIYSTALLAFENIFFIHGNLALLDVPPILFALLGFHFYLGNRTKLSALCFGLAILSKEIALLYLLVLAIFHISRNFRGVGLANIKRKAIRTLTFILVLSATFLVPLTAYDVVYRPEVLVSEKEGKYILTNGIEHSIFITRYASGLTMDILKDPDRGNYAWNWVIPSPEPYKPMSYYIAMVNTSTTETLNSTHVVVRSELSETIAWKGIGNLPLWWSFWFIIPVATYRLFARKASDLDIFVLSWIVGTYVPLLYASYFGNRVVYPFYFIVTVPALSLGFPYLATQLTGKGYLGKFVLFVFLLAVLLFFAYYYPVKSLK